MLLVLNIAGKEVLRGRGCGKTLFKFQENWLQFSHRQSPSKHHTQVYRKLTLKMEAIINYEKNNYGSIKHNHSILIDLRAQRSPMSLQEVNKWNREKQAPQAGIHARCTSDSRTFRIWEYLHWLCLNCTVKSRGLWGSLDFRWAMLYLCDPLLRDMEDSTWRLRSQKGFKGVRIRRWWNRSLLCSVTFQVFNWKHFLHAGQGGTHLSAQHSGSRGKWISLSLWLAWSTDQVSG